MICDPIVVNIIYISKVTGGEVRPQCWADRPHVAGIIDQFESFSIHFLFLFKIHISAYIYNT